VLVHRRWWGWRLATALALLAAAISQVLFSWLAPHVGGSYGTDMLVAWSVVGVVHAMLTGLPPAASDPAHWDRHRAADLASALVVPITLTAYFWLATQRSGPPWLAWSMANDSANNIILNREFLVQGGLLKSQGNAAPLATILNSSWGAVGIQDMEHAELVRHLITTSAQFGLLGWLLLSFLAAVIVLAVARGPRGSRVLIAVAAGLVPWLWFVSGIAFAYGYANAFAGMVTLVLGWMCWLERERHPVSSLTGQVLATWVAATAWGPVAVIPACWMAATIVVERRALRRARWRLLWPGLVFLGAATYAYVVTLKDVSATSGALALDGGHPLFDYWWALGVAIALLLVTVLFWGRVSSTVRLGTWVAMPAAGLGVWYLIRARAAMPEWWGYYPVKFSWIVLSALFVVVLASLQQPLRALSRRAWGGTGAVLGLMALVALMVQISAPLRPLTLASVATPVSLHDQTTFDAPVADMFDLIEQEPKSIVARYSAGPGGNSIDSFVNFWMLQMGARDIQDPVRFAAYSMDASDPASVCSGIANWQGDVTVWTRDERIEAKLAKVCDPAFDYRVELVADDARE
jgi:hypothetical protein